MLKQLTIAQVLEWRPCNRAPGEKYGRDGLKALWAGREAITPLEACDLPIPPEDILWLLLRPDILPNRSLHLLACDFAEHGQPPNADPRSLAAIATKRRWVNGKATD